MHPTAEAQLLFVEPNEVMLRRILHRIMIGKISLQNHLALGLSPPGPQLVSTVEMFSPPRENPASPAPCPPPPRQPMSRHECRAPWQSSVCPPAGRVHLHSARSMPVRNLRGRAPYRDPAFRSSQK